MLTIRLGSREDLEWAQATVEKHHYLHQRVDNRARPMVYVIGDHLGLIMAGIPHATRCRGWYGYPGPSGKFGWCWKLKQPRWTWEEIPLLQPRNLRLAM